MVSSVKLAELWQRLGYRVLVACMGDLNGKWKMENGKWGSRVSIEKVSETLEIHRMKDFFFPDPWNYGIALGFAGYVRRLIKREEPDIIIANKLLFWTTLSVIPLRLMGKRVIVSTDAFVGMTWWPRGRFPKICAAIYAWTLGWLILRCAWKVVTFHPQPPKLLRRLGIEKKTVMVPTGIDVTRYALRVTRNGQSPTVTYVGRLESVKGVDDFLAATVACKKDFPDITIRVVGWYPSTSSGQADHPLVKQYERDVVFTGLRDDVPDILKDTDIFVLPSYSEGLSNALMEAMSSGCACSATDHGGNRFLIQSGGSGFL